MRHWATKTALSAETLPSRAALQDSHSICLLPVFLFFPSLPPSLFHTIWKHSFCISPVRLLFSVLYLQFLWLLQESDLNILRLPLAQILIIEDIIPAA